MNIMEERKLGFGCVRMPVLQDGKQDSFDYTKLRNCSIHFWSTVLRILTRGIHIKRITGNFSSQQVYYNNFTMNSHGKAEDCIKCGKCEQACPQHLTIRKYLDGVADKF